LEEPDEQRRLACINAPDYGCYPSSNAQARALKLEPGWVAEVLRLTMPALDIVESILDGRQPRHLDL
jgi:hypothetical protein